MPQSMWKLALFAAATGFVLWAGLARAQDIEVVRPHLLIDASQPHPVLKALHVPVPLGCWAKHNGYGCGSLRSEGVFIFGSCRAFWSEPCLKEPPPPPWSPEANVPPDVDDHPAGSRRRCNCGW